MVDITLDDRETALYAELSVCSLPGVNVRLERLLLGDVYVRSDANDVQVLVERKAGNDLAGGVRRRILRPRCNHDSTDGWMSKPTVCKSGPGKG